MARVTYQASAKNRQWSPNLEADTANRILKQAEDYREKLKNARDFEAAQEAQFINEYTASLQRSVDSVREVDLEKERQTRALASYKVAQMKAQADRARTLGGSFDGNDRKTKDWITFITEASKVAATTFKDIKAAQDKADEEWVANKTALRPYSVKGLGNNVQTESSRYGEALTDAAAAGAELNGEFEVANDLRNASPGRQAHYTKYRALETGRQSYSMFQKDMYAAEASTTVIYQGQEVPINDPRLRNSDAIREVFPQYRNQLFKAQGFDISSLLLTKGLAESNQRMEQALGEQRQEELLAAKKNWLDQSNTTFTTRVRDPDQTQAAAIDFYQDNFNSNGGNHRAARAAVMNEFKNPSIASDKAFDAWKQTVLPGQNRSIEELYPDEIREVRQARLETSQSVQNELDVTERMEAKEIARKVAEARIADIEDDNDVDLSPSAVKEQIQKYERLGPNYKVAKEAWESLIPELSSTRKDNALNDDFQDLADRGALSEDFVMRSEGSEELKRKWLKEINATAEQSVPEKALNDFKGIARAMLMDRTKETPGASGQSNSASTKRALRRATEDFQRDYVTALRDGQTQSQAAAYAEGQFNAKFNDEGGLYKTTGLERNDKGLITPGKFLNFGAQASEQIDEPLVNLNKKIEEFGASVVDQKEVIPYATLERVSKEMTNNNRMIIPPAIVTLADSTGGKLSVMDVLNRQLKANDLDQIPPDMFNTAKEAQDSINPQWQQTLNYKPQVETTDAALIASGQEPIYTTSTPVQERVKAIFSARESPNAGYDAINRGQAGDTPGGATARYGKPLTQMTVGEVKQLQATELNAVGKYQFIASTLREAAADAGITDDMLFNEAVQDRIFFVHLDKYGAYQPWERWWIEQGGAGLALTPEEKQVISSFRAGYNPSDPWRQPKNLNPAVLPALPLDSSIEGGVAPLDLEAMGISTTPIN